MNFDIRAYAKVYPNWINEKTCDEIVENLSSNNWVKHSYYEPKSKESKSFDTELSISMELPKFGEAVNKKIWEAFEQYLVKDFNFSWYSGWTGYTGARYNRYEIGNEMRLHCDHIHSIFDGERKGIPILTALGGLNNDYEGGELVMWENEIIDLKAGDIMVFPSNFLYPHMVKPVTKGTRYSYVSWAW
jgi:predicted 2-oxoglutarate/Fe(II)-dependent dioxygenase YbiX